jgi:hypothetical protein
LVLGGFDGAGLSGLGGIVGIFRNTPRNFWQKVENSALNLLAIDLFRYQLKIP